MRVKKLKVITILALIFFIMLGIGAYILPYHTYYLALSEGIENSYINLQGILRSTTKERWLNQLMKTMK